MERAHIQQIQFARLSDFHRTPAPKSAATSVHQPEFLFVSFVSQLSNSNASQVVLRNVGFRLSGNFSCEVTADAPSFTTRTARISMKVIGMYINI